MLISAAAVYLGCDNAGEKSTDPPDRTALSSLWTRPVKQPLAFDHAAHIKAEDMECTDCHRFADKGPYATLPRLRDCKDCHSEPQGKNPEEPKVREYLESGKEIPWVIVNRLPGHVYFSHRAHVEFGEMKCWDCHRDMREVSAPVAKPDIAYLTMGRCIKCHAQRQVETDCSNCHK